MGVTRLVLSALLIPLAGCAASKPATDLTYQDVRPDRIANQLFLADAIAAVEDCRPPFSDLVVVRPNFVSPPTPVDGGCGGQARVDAGPEYVEAVTRITEVHDAVVRDWEVRLQSGPEAAETRAADATLLHCLDQAGFGQREPGDPSPAGYGIGTGDVALDNAAQRCSDDTLYGRRVTAQRVRTLRSVLGLYETEISRIGTLRSWLESCARRGGGADRARFGLPE